jgi:enoyl-CoA hydratase/carnithine racemase
MLHELEKAWDGIRRDPEVRAVVIIGAGDKAFTVGADRGAFQADSAEPGNADVARALREHATPGAPGYEWDIGDSIGPKTRRCWKPVVAAVNGIACGGAFHLLGEADIILAAESATFFDPHVTYGMTSGYESVHMLQRMPIGDLLRMQLLGTYERMSASRALQIGLVSEVVPAERLRDAAAWIAGSIAKHPVGAVQGTLRAIWASQGVPKSSALALQPHFLAMATPQEWTDGQSDFSSGRRVQPRVR